MIVVVGAASSFFSALRLLLIVTTHRNIASIYLICQSSVHLYADLFILLTNCNFIGDIINRPRMHVTSIDIMGVQQHRQFSQ